MAKRGLGWASARVAMLAISMGSGATHAAEDQSSGNYWKALCDQQQYDYACAYYINGLVDGLMMAVTENSLVSRGSASQVYGYCPPTTASVGDMKQVFLQYLKDNPKQRQYRGASLALEAWRRKWPCPK